MARGNQREKAREKNLKAQASQKSKNTVRPPFPTTMRVLLLCCPSTLSGTHTPRHTFCLSFPCLTFPYLVSCVMKECPQ
ncbi:uncharacterized protein EI97DRAFT_430695 [Westerdykella ornata]|uniref:Small EDRK-rich factor-like N-terminal domain-containing protein n=1 Tax=Westerdykella ornata TaxID=318751 RepID=A0A6A6JTU3_WESOR|nr:uncharacterized protein EI97DRAFT_430695 [Westerdykella ornata]KAF2279664.1 hypothetical protein EI97DRAFT_430695 [Westerdykella ornata]